MYRWQHSTCSGHDRDRSATECQMFSRLSEDIMRHNASSLQMYWVITRSVLNGCHECWRLKRNKSVWQLLLKISVCIKQIQQFLCRYVTMDETWAHHFDHETKLQSTAWKHTTSAPRQSNSARLHSPAKLWHMCILGQWGCSHDWLHVGPTWKRERLLRAATMRN